MFKKILAANRSEIATRIFRAARELNIDPVGIYSEEDRLTLHRFNTSEAHLVGRGKGPIEAYLDIEDIIRVARESGCDAVHPGYGFLSENPDFAERCAAEGITFVGPDAPFTSRRVAIRCSARTEGAGRRNGLDTALGEAIVVVRDHGPGIAKRQRRRALALFQRLENEATQNTKTETLIFITPRILADTLLD